MRKRIALMLSTGLLALVAVAPMVHADVITVSGADSQGLFGPVPVTGNTPIGNTPIVGSLNYGTYGYDSFTFTDSIPSLIPGNPPITQLTLNMTILADNGVCLGGGISTSCVGLYIYNAVATDPSQVTGFLDVKVSQPFNFSQPYPTDGSSIATIQPASEFLIGSCTPGGASVSLTTTFPGSSVSPGALPPLFANCSTTNPFNLTNPGPNFLTLVNSQATPFYVISNEVVFNLNGGSINLPAGSCADATTCVMPNLPQSTPAPEPSSLALLGSGALGLLGLIKQRAWFSRRG